MSTNPNSGKKNKSRTIQDCETKLNLLKIPSGCFSSAVMATRRISEDEDDEERRERKSKVQALERRRQTDCIKIVKALIKIPWLFQQEVPRWQVEEFLKMRMKKKWPASFPLKVDVLISISIPKKKKEKTGLNHRRKSKEGYRFDHERIRPQRPI